MVGLKITLSPIHDEDDSCTKNRPLHGNNMIVNHQ